MKNVSTSNATVDQGAIAQTAKGLWEKAGCPSGRDLEFWLSAESQLRGATQAKPQTSAANQGKPAMGSGWVSPTIKKEQEREPASEAHPMPR